MDNHLDRQTQPEIYQIENIKIPEPVIIYGKNGVPFHIINMGEQDVVRIDIMISAGKWEQKKLLTAMFTNLMLKEGVEGLTSQQVAEQLDYLGAWLQPSATFHNSYITLYSLNKYSRETFSLLEKIVKKPLFPEEEFETIKNRRKQNFIVENEKVEVKAFNKFVELLYGKEYPYGSYAEQEDFDNITIDDLKRFHDQYYNHNNCKVIITGKVTDEILNDLVIRFGDTTWGYDEKNIEKDKIIKGSVPGYYFIEKKDALQSAVRIGIPVIGRNHPDYAGLRVLNTLFGGYFGSRLMANIREEKGYTYGIGSNITTLKNQSYLTISTQTATEYVDEVIKECFYEIERLRTELVPQDELQMMKSYLMGEMSRLFDGPFSIADAHQSLLANDMTSEYYYNLINTIKSITSEDLMSYAIKYLNKEDFYIVVAGQKS